MNEIGGQLLLRSSPRPRNEEWIGLFPIQDAQSPVVVFQAKEIPNYAMHGTVQQLSFNDTQGCYTVMAKSRVLLPITAGQRIGRNVDVHHNFSRIPARVRVQDVLKGPRKKTIYLYYGKVQDLSWDPDRL
jgi:hypothetical protein